jgi:hypothetical protein
MAFSPTRMVFEVPSVPEIHTGPGKEKRVAALLAVVPEGLVAGQGDLAG